MMKKLLLVLVASSFATLSAFAQQAPDRLRTEAMEATRVLASRVSLDDARSIQVRRLTYERLVQENQIKTLYGDDPAMRQTKLHAVEQEYAEKLKGVLTEAQFQRYLATAPKNPAGAAQEGAPTQISLSDTKVVVEPAKNAEH